MRIITVMGINSSVKSVPAHHELIFFVTTCREQIQEVTKQLLIRDRPYQLQRVRYRQRAMQLLSVERDG